MTMRVLVVEESKVAKVIEYASKPEHWYRPGAPAPGDSEPYRLVMGDYRVVFTYTVGQEKGTADPRLPDEVVFRHLSISLQQLEREPKYPVPDAVELIAKAFGFTGNMDEWMVASVPGLPVVAVAQVIPEVTLGLEPAV